MTGRAFNRRSAPPPASGISGNDYAAYFTDFLDQAPPGTPWCFWYGALEPHRGYGLGSGIHKGGRRISDIDRVPAYWPDTGIVRSDILDYAFEVEHFDRHLGRMLDLLDRKGMASNTLVIVTSDHGMPFPRIKGQAYPFANRVPLAMRWPAGIRSPGRVLTDFVSFVDVGPTLLELAGLDWARTGLAPPAGRSLRPLPQSGRSGRVDPRRDHVLIGRERQEIGRPNDAGYPVRGIVTDRYVFLRNVAPDRWPSGNPETGYLDTLTNASAGRAIPGPRARATSSTATPTPSPVIPTSTPVTSGGNR